MKRALEEFNESIQQLEEVVTEEANSSPLYTKLGRKNIRLLLLIHISSLRSPTVRAAHLQKTKSEVPYPVFQHWVPCGFHAAPSVPDMAG